MKISRISKLGLIFGLVASLGGASVGFAAKPTNKVLRIGMTQEFENFNPILMSMLATTYIYKMVNRNLVTIDVKGNWVPQMAKEIPTIDNKLAKFSTLKGEKVIEAQWEIREGAKWGDGTPVTGHDVAFAHRVALDNNIAVPEREVYSNVREIRVDKKNPRKFVMIHQAEWDYYTLGTFYVLPKHLEETVFNKHHKAKEGYSKNSLYTTSPLNKGLYNGPYLVKEMKLGSHIALEPNPNFYGQSPKIKKIILKLIPNTATLESNLRSGTIDMISLLGFTFDQALAFEKRVKENKWPYHVNFKSGLIYEHIDLNLDNEILKDKTVRQALVYAIDRKKLTQALFEGRQKPALHNLAPIDPWFTDDASKIKIYKTSPRKAKKMLDKAGWKMAKDGYRYKDGKKLSFVLMTTSGNKTRELVQVFLQNEWKKVGVDIQIKNEPARVYFGETTHKRKFPHMAMYAWISSPMNNPKSNMHSKNIPSDKNGWSGQNYTGWINKTVDQKLDAVDVEFSHEKRLDLIHAVLNEYTTDVPVIPLYYRADVSVTPKNLKGYELTGHQFGPANSIEYWELEADTGLLSSRK